MDLLRPWTEKRRKAYRLPDGRYDNVRLAPMIEKMRAAGCTLPQLREITGLPTTTLESSSRHLSGVPKGMVFATDLAKEIGISQRAMVDALRRKGYPARRYGVRLIIPESEVKQVKALFKSRVTAGDPDWLTVFELCALLHVEMRALHLRLRRAPWNTIRTAREVGQAGNSLRYNRADAQRVLTSLPITLNAPPKGTLSVPQVAALLNINESTVRYWGKRAGAPSVLVARAAQPTRHFHPDQLSAWLMAQPTPYRRSLGRTLARLTSKERAA